MSRAVRLLVNQLIHDLHDRPEDFFCDKFHLTDKKTLHVYWVANEVPYYRMEVPYEVKFGFWHGWRFVRALEKWKATQMIQASLEAK